VKIVSNLLNHLISIGHLRVIDWNGLQHEFGPDETPCVTIRFHDSSLNWKLFFNPRLYLGEAYMDGTLTIEEGSIYDFLDLIGRNIAASPPHHPLSPLYTGSLSFFRWFQQFNPTAFSRRRIAHHYDLSEKLYPLFLDDDRQYSCAYFLTDEESLEQAQENKKRHIAAKLCLKPDLKILDIGSGWGGMALHLARACNARVTGITLSEEQLKASRRRAQEAGLDGQVEFHLMDYREIEGPFDRIVSVGMFEHVGVDHYRHFFDKIKTLLTADGIALLHSIGSMHGPQDTNPWIRKYIFPGGHFPALSEVMTAVEKSGLWTTDIEILRLHYALTLREWRHRFLANQAKARALYDEEFCRMWEFYLAISEMAFRHRDLMNFQMQLTQQRDATPLTRDYMYPSNAKKGTFPKAVDAA